MKKAKKILSMLLSAALILSAVTIVPSSVRADETAEDYVTDVITVDDTNAPKQVYVDWTAQKSDDNNIESDAVYSGNTSKNYGAIQMRSKNSNSGIVTTESGGYVHKIKVYWSDVNGERSIKVYGSNTAYSSPQDLYNNETQGILLGTFSYYDAEYHRSTETSELIIEEDYLYIGIRSSYGALYLDSIEFQWDTDVIHPEWNWAADYSSATAVFTDESGVHSEAASITSSITKQPTYFADGERTYTAVVTYNGTTYKDRKTEVIPKLVFDGSVPYIDENGEPQNSPMGTVLLTGQETELNAGWYAVAADITYNDTVYLNGDVKLILCDGAGADMGCDSFYLSTDNDSITIYGQENNSGRIYGHSEYGYNSPDVISADSSYARPIAGRITMNGGTIERGSLSSVQIEAKNITINGGILDECAVIASETVTINGGDLLISGAFGQLNAGTVTINGGKTVVSGGADAIDASEFNFNGGDFRVCGGINADSINLSWTHGSDTINADKYYILMMTDYNHGTYVNQEVTLVKNFMDNDGNVYPAGTYSNGELNSKALYPDIDLWNDLQQRINAADSGDTITLTGSCIAHSNDSAITIPAGKALTIDLNGYTIDRNLADKAAVAGGNVITVNCDLTIIDSSSEKTGKITGGNNTENGGGIIINGVDFVIENAAITGNKSAGDGGGVWGNGWVTVKDASITDNTSAGNGGGVCFNSNSTSNKLKVEGSANITGNKKGDTENNVYLTSQIFVVPVNSSSSLNADARIGISVPDNTSSKNITDYQMRDKFIVDNFISDSEKYLVSINSSGNARLQKSYVFHFDANGGEGTMEDIVVYDPTVTLPECTFTPPEGKRFKAWSDGFTTNEYPADEELGIAPGMYEFTIIPIWADVYQITVADSTNGTILANKTEAIAGELVKLNVAPDEGYMLDTLSVTYGNGQTMQVNNNRFYMPQGDAVIEATFKVDENYHRTYFVGHTLSLNGDIGVNFFVDLTAEEASDATVNFSWVVNDVEKTASVNLNGTAPTVNGYKASCRIAPAEMTYEITATLVIDGEEMDTDVYSAKQYADYIMTDEFASKYTGTGNRTYENLKALVQAMLDYGTRAQISFDRDKDNPANGGVYTYTDAVDPENIAGSASDMTENLSTYGLTYAGSTVVLLTETSIRHYYRITDQTLFDAVKNDITFNGTKAGYIEKSGYIYFEYAGIAAADIDTVYTLHIGTNDYNYSVMDFIKNSLSKPRTEENAKTQDLLTAMYYYNQMANAYFAK
ncbi:MAG: hypothetical protein IJM37_08995 [Lachnospiraceae bacterium]|nr:hypothetical protein [Lachnospiraceae bacterium]